MRNKLRPYYTSSSFKMALLFTALLTVSMGILAYFGYYFSRGPTLDAMAQADMQGSYRLMMWLCIFSILSMVAVIAISFMISIFVVSRTNRIALTAQDIMNTGNLSRRIDVDSRWDDLSYVAIVLNRFLERVENLVENVRQVSDNIAHDMRTPLTRLRTDLEKLKEQDKDSPEKYDRVLAESDHILTMFGALLRISNIEARQQKYLFEETSLARIIADVADLYDPLSEEKNITMTLDIAETSVSGDRDLLFQAFANLLDNAIKFTPPGGAVRIEVAHPATVRIIDTGPGIREEDKTRIFQRFYRAEQSRHTHGYGLGLSMVDAVMRLHSADITITNRSPGLMIEMVFPKKT